MLSFVVQKTDSTPVESSEEEVVDAQCMQIGPLDLPENQCTVSKTKKESLKDKMWSLLPEIVMNCRRKQSS